jgi:hypothetical protein
MKKIFKKESKKIVFTSISEYAYEVSEPPKPASLFIPEWWKKMSLFTYEDNKLRINNRQTNYTAKKCVPMLDGMISGYIVTLWADVLVSTDDQLGYPNIDWRVSSPIFEVQPLEATKGIPTPEGYSPIVFKFLNQWRMKTPSGYSSIIIPFMGDPDPVFKPLPGIVDTDKYEQEITINGWIKKDFNGIIKKGTPLCQIIPFKREESWESESLKGDFYKSVYIQDKTQNADITNHYPKNVRQDKHFK